MIDLDAIEARARAATPGRVRRDSFALLPDWEVLIEAGLWGKRTHVRCLASDPENCILIVEVRPGRRVNWEVSPPPGDNGGTFDEGRIVLAPPESTDRLVGGGDANAPAETAALAEAKRLAEDAWERWLAEDAWVETPPPGWAVEDLQAHARTDIPALVARVRELEAQVSVAMNAATLIPRHDDERALEVLNTALAGDALPRNCWSCENHTAEGCRIVDLGMPQGGDGLSEEWENTMAWCRKTPMPNAMPPLDADGCPGYAPRVAP